MALIACQNVSLGYDGSAVLSGVNFELNGGDYLCIVGENGSGKSTLIKGLLRLKTPMSGAILTGDGLLPTEIGYLPQQAAIQRDFPASVFEVVLSGRQNSLKRRPFYSREDKKEAYSKIELMGITTLKSRSFQELSGGQQRRVLLARSLCATKKALLLDEPVAGLDPVAASELYDLIKRINDELGVTVIMVSHDIAAAMRHAKLILHLERRQLFFGTAPEYARSEAGRLFLGGEKHV